MKITDDLLPINEYSRPGRKMKDYLGIILHWTGNPRTTARQNRVFFADRTRGTLGYGSAHYIIDFTGEIIRCIPDDEIAYHCGSSKPDPTSGKVYTDWAREKFGPYAEYYKTSSPNNCTIGIELCTMDDIGNFREVTVEEAIELTAHLCRTYRIPVENIGRHYDVVGWKDCPRLWVNKPQLFADFKEQVKEALS